MVNNEWVNWHIPRYLDNIILRTTLYDYLVFYDIVYFSPTDQWNAYNDNNGSGIIGTIVIKCKASGTV